MSSRVLNASFVPKTYAELRRGVEAIVFAGRRKIEDAWLRTYHDTGRLIHEHLLANQDRADYGAELFARLADDTGISKRVLYECVQLFRCFPIVRASAQLTRSHYLLLCQVGDAKQRQTLTVQAARNDWTVAELTSRVRAINAAVGSRDANGSSNSGGERPAPDNVEKLTPKRGTPGLHPMVDRGAGPGLSGVERLSVDLGFKLYRSLSTEQARRYARDDIVRLAEDGSIRRETDASKADLFTYSATIRRVVDGDTLVVAIQVAPEIWLEEKLRLRGLDCPEMSTPEGKVAKRFVDALVASATEVIVATTKPDKYDRYLADVFVATPSGEVFLNNALLEHGHAIRKDAWEFRDWEKDLLA